MKTTYKQCNEPECKAVKPHSVDSATNKPECEGQCSIRKRDEWLATNR